MRTYTALFATMIVSSPLAAHASADPCGELLLVTADDNLESWLQLTAAQLGELQAIRDDANARIGAAEQEWQIAREQDLAASRAAAVLSTWQRQRCISGGYEIETNPQPVVVHHSPIYVQRPLPRRVPRGRVVIVPRRPVVVRRSAAPVHRTARPVFTRRASRTVTVQRHAPTYRRTPVAHGTPRASAPTQRQSPIARPTPRAAPTRSAPVQQRERRGRR